MIARHVCRLHWNVSMTTAYHLSHTLGQNIDSDDPDYSEHLLDVNMEL